jgi:hypothetical protein
VLPNSVVTPSGRAARRGRPAITGLACCAAVMASSLSPYRVAAQAPSRPPLAANAGIRTAAARPPRPVEFAAGLHLGGPTRASVALGAMWVTWRSGEDRREGPTLIAEPGLRAGRASLAYSAWTGRLGSGYVARATFLRTWAGAPHRNYVGLEAQLVPIFGFGLRGGGFMPIQSSMSPRKPFWLLDLSLGL